MGGSDWTNMNPGTAPSASVNMAMVYDSSADRIIVFGGYDGSPQGSDRTWAYDFESNTWTDLAPAVHPPAGWLDRAAYDRWAERMILFGGYDGVAGALSNQTWAFNFQANAWTNLQPARHPSARSRQGMAFDAQSDRTILFGGLTAEGDYSSETWAYRIDGNSWANMTSEVRPPGRRSPGMVYDAAADRIILFGGYDSSSGIVYNDTWAYDFESNSWTNRNPPAAPSPRFGMGLAYDARLDRSILFGGAEGGDNVTWAYDFTNNSWAVLSTAHSPPTHAFQGMDYDVQSARTIMFGGGLGNPGNDTWALQTSPPVPLAPENLTATAGNGTVSLRWDPPADNGSSPVAYRVYRGPDVDHLSALADLGDVRSYVDGNVTNGVAYVYRVSATNANGEGPLSSPVTATPDGQPPRTSATLAGCEGLAGWFTCPNVTLILVASDENSGVASTVYRMDQGAWQNYSAPFSVAGDGVHSVDFYSVDLAGNIESVETVSPSIDTVPPTSQAILTGSASDGYWFRSEVTVSFDASDATSGVASIAYRVDSGVWQAYGAPFDVLDGMHVVESYATDVAGNPEGISRVSFGVDAVAPATGVTLSGPLGENGWYLGPVTVAIRAEDATSGVSISYRLDDGPWSPYAGSFVVAGEGIHRVDYAAVDGAGNSETGDAAVSIDSTPPLVVLEMSGIPGREDWYVSDVLVSLRAEDGGSGLARLEVRLDGGSWAEYASALPLTDGVHTVSYRASDAAGNMAGSRTVMVSVDATSPQSTAVLSGERGDHGWYRTPVVVSLQASDATSGVDVLAYRVGTGTWRPYGDPFTLSSGVHTIQFTATDKAGWLEPAQTLTVRVDETPPALAAVQTPGHSTSHDVTLTWSASDSGSGVDRFEVAVDGGGWTRLGTEPTARLHLADGAHTVVIRATDAAGNRAESSVAITIDTNMFSLGGPYGGAPTGVLLVAIIVLVSIAIAWSRRRQRR